MKLTFEQIKSIAHGVSRVVADNGKIRFLRFTQEQEKMYEEFPDFYKKTFASAGVRLEFVTDSSSLTLRVDVESKSSRTYFNHDIYVNGELCYTLGDDVKNSTDGHMTLEGSYSLGQGDKTVCIYFPWSACSEVISLELDNGATFSPVEHSRRMILFGDSITHGYDAFYPSAAYASLLTDALDADGINKGIGAERFHKELALLSDGFTPDLITVAYGTNDWRGANKEQFEEECSAFYENLTKTYPDTPIFALAPIWRGEGDTKITSVGPLSRVAEKLREVAAVLPNVTVIDCYDFVPHDPSMFSPDVLHPNDKGFAHYAEGVIKAIKNELNID